LTNINRNSQTNNEGNAILNLISFPPNIEYGISNIFVEMSAVRDVKTHHYKQWVGIRYSKDCKMKYIVAGFRYIVVERPFSMKRYSHKLYLVFFFF
jgi:hypothetical protein